METTFTAVKTASPTTKPKYPVTGTATCQACRGTANIHRIGESNGFISCPECTFSQPLVGYCFTCN